MKNASGGLLGRLAGIRRFVCTALVIVLSPIMLNCYGYFPLTRAIYEVNGNVPIGILRNVVFWLFIPVYGVAMIGDALVLNLIDFWTGVGVSAMSIQEPDGRTLTIEPSADGREAVLTVSADGTIVNRVRFVRVSEDVCEVRNESGEFAGSAIRTPDGGLQLTDPQGRVVTTITSAHIAQLKGM